MKDLAIYGAGGFGREVALLIEQINTVKKTWNFIGFFDDAKSSNEELRILGGGAALNNFQSELSVIIAIADPKTRRSIVAQLNNPRIDFPVIVHPKADRGSHSNLFQRGTIVTNGVILTTGITIGEFVILNLATTIGHDCKIGSYSSIMPGANISGNVTIGEQTLIGTGASVLQNLGIGSGVKVGAGAVVTKHVKDSIVVVGIPAKEKKSI